MLLKYINACVDMVMSKIKVSRQILFWSEMKLFACLLRVIMMSYSIHFFVKKCKFLYIFYWYHRIFLGLPFVELAL